MAAVSTDSSGNYTIKGLNSGSYYVWIDDQSVGWHPSTEIVVGEYFDNKPDSHLATPVPVVLGLVSQNVNFSLSSRGNISGKVTSDSNGTGIPGVTMCLYDSNWSINGCSDTHSDGTYSFPNVKPGSYYLMALSKSGYIGEYYNNATTRDGATLIIVLSESNVTNINLGLSSSAPISGGSISGRITRDSDGVGVSDIGVRAYNSDHSVSAMSDSSGYYRIDNVPVGEYLVSTVVDTLLFTGNTTYAIKYYINATTISSATKVPVSLGAETKNINIGIFKGGAISGAICCDSKYPTSSFFDTVDIYDSNWNRILGISHASQYPHPECINYNTPGFLLPGSYYVGVHSTDSTYCFSKYYNNATNQSAATSVQVTSGAVTPNINLDLSKYGTISGKITRDSDGTGIPGIMVQIISSSNWSVLGSTSTDASGNYSLRIWPSAYYVRTSNSLGYSDEYYNNANSQDGALAVTVLSNMETPNINFGLALAENIYGRVIRDSDGAAVAGATIQAYNASWIPVTSTTTDSSGSYSIALIEGNYYLHVSATGFIDEYYNNAFSQNAAASITVPQSASINFSLSAGYGSISGRVLRDIDYYPISYISVAAFNRNGEFVKTSETDPAGNYRVTGLAPGTYYIRAGVNAISKYYNNAASIRTASGITVAIGETPNINFVLSVGILNGSVKRESDGAGIPGVVVQAVNSLDSNDNNIPYTVTTDYQGWYGFDKIARGKYYVSTSNAFGYIDKYYNNADQPSASPVDVTLLPDGTGTYIYFQLALGGSISGRITRAIDGTSIAKALISAYDSRWNLAKSAVSDPSGNFSIKGLKPGDYYLEASASGYIEKYYPDAVTRDSASAITVVHGADASSHDVSMSSGGAISGRITRSTDGSGIAEVTVQAFSGSGKIFQSTSSDSMGNYTIAGLGPGNYFIATSNSLGFIDKYYGASSSQSLTAGSINTLSINSIHTAFADSIPVVPVNPGVVTPSIDIVLEAGGSISGLVTAESGGAALPNITVRAYSGSRCVKTAVTDSTGAYSIAGIAPGSYSVRTYHASGYWDSSYNTAVSVSSNTDHGNINFSLVGGLSINGSVVSESDGAGIHGIKVIAYNSNWEPVASSMTDSSGAYNIEGLTPGEYYLQTLNSLGYKDEYCQDADSPEAAAKVNLIKGSRTIDFSLGSIVYDYFLRLRQQMGM
jgi:hypothetical protein